MPATDGITVGSVSRAGLHRIAPSLVLEIGDEGWLVAWCACTLSCCVCCAFEEVEEGGEGHALLVG